MKKNFNVSIGLRIRKKREELRLSREKLSEIADISPQFLAEIELGRRGMSSVTLVKICSSLSVSSDYILLGRESHNNFGKVGEILSNLDPKYMPDVEDILTSFIIALNR